LYAVLTVWKSSALRRIVGTGLVAALAVVVGGSRFEQIRFGASDDTAIARVAAEIQERFDASADNLRAISSRVAAEPTLIRAAARDAAAAGKLFDVLGAALPDDQTHTGITVYGTGQSPVAWLGHVTETPGSLDERVPFVLAVGALGPRLVYVEPVTVPPASRVGTIVVEQVLEPIRRSPSLSDRFVLSTSIAPVTLRVGAVTPTSASSMFHIVSRAGGTLVDAEVSPRDIAQARLRWRRGMVAGVLAILGATLLGCAGWLVHLRRRSRTSGRNLLMAGGVAVAIIASRGVLGSAATRLDSAVAFEDPLGLLLTSLAAAALVWLLIDLIEGRRVARPRVRLLPINAGGRVTLVYVLAGLLGAVMIAVYSRFLESIVLRTAVDLLHFSLHPVDITRLGLAFALVMLHASVIWTAVAAVRLPRLWWRLPRGRLSRLAAPAWAAGASLGVVAVRVIDPAVVWMPQAIALAAVAACAASLGALRVRARRVSQSMRLAGLFLALVVPSIAMYPSLSAFAIRAKEELVAREYGPQVVKLREDLQQRLARALEQVDALPALPQLVAARGDDQEANLAFTIWSQTELERFRLTSAVELYNRNGQRVSRFALFLPEYGTTPFRAVSCGWDVSDDVSPIGASESHVLRASRGICVGGRPVGGIIVRAMLDYRTLPFISSRSPYLESLRSERVQRAEGVSGRDVEFVFYGWSRAPLFASGTSVWTLTDDDFQAMVDSRTAFWSSIDRGDAVFRVHLINDRGGIYALGYAVLTLFGHLINLAELVTLVLVLFVLLLSAATIFNSVFSRTPTTGRALLREIRSSFYRKLRLAFWAAFVIPVIVLALATRAYFATELTAGIEEAAARTATVAQRLVEDYAALQQRGAGGLDTLDDDIMRLVSRAIDEDVNLFDGASLQATSALDLYASQLLSRRTPSEVYRRLVLERAPTYVGEQDVGTVRYLVAAAPVLGEGIVTVPITLRPLELERQRDELDRRVLFAAVFFSVLGLAAGFWMAERIADPVNRLTRATRRIAGGDLDARIAATSADELGRLVADFNQMAADLRRQRSELERTQRLEAWADMARQVAHDIKNPLTPIQLSAEHARRVNIDHGRPLSPVLDECVTAILGQVRLLRQIAAEFSSFASSPTPKPEPTALPALIDEVVEPYRAGLVDRIGVAVDAPPDLPSVTVDRTLFARALTNILENALHAMPGRGQLTIAVRPGATRAGGAGAGVAATGRTVTIDVADTGVGMDEEALSRIFQPYFSTKATGTGLGLTIAKRNIELNQGTIEVRSTRGVGTTVTITLPAD
jgi:signal transduction histidine kinase